ncbi:TIGR03986 family CRISPR-associated RAMP protein [Anaerosalibacter bizertensis]|uniref:TIGR03986 family type III CRISPR-associated RAMP protein n=1 Tax=Anaerosalibacter bizertensis TaxID=932217 RepID=UPI001C0EB84E|nr:TIGR03986 family CRISPR-associated RAMP protein [Anaerosalibacter bizertensis]MBU5293803.1 TIGR03986 family CRISPR-associated RAMP protein [Anaerosalibacter bizertensis]
MKPIRLNKEKLKYYSVSPYNFVSFPKFSVSRYEDVEELPVHNSYKDIEGKELLNGVIEYRLVAETPVLVSKGINNEKNREASFFINNRGEFTIPGSTIRGITRTNAQILSFSNIVGNKDDKDRYNESEIEDSRYMYREIAGNNALSINYKNELGINPRKRIVENVRAGYMYRKNEREYVIEPAMKINGFTNYFRIDEIELRKIVDNDIEREINFMYRKDILSIEKKLKNTKNKNKKATELHRIRNDSYSPYQTPISFNFDKGSNKVVKVGIKGRYSYDGYIVCSEYMRGKLGHFIIPEPDDHIESINVNDESISHYIDDLIRTKKMKKTGEMQKGKEFFGLPKNTNTKNKKPVFFINKGNILHFGFTPYLRVFYRKTVLDGIPERYKDVNGISYVDAIFGFSNKYDTSYKSRVSFEDIIVEEKAEVDKDSSIEMLLAEPKPTSYNLYLKQNIDSNKKNLNIYDGDFRLRGIKQYWLKEYIESPDFEKKKNTNMIFKMKPLKEGTSFKGKIYFNNLHKDELGLLLWSLRLNKDCFQNIGLAKPYGFGRVKVKNLILKIENLQKKYSGFSFNYMEKCDFQGYINYYKEKFSQEYLNGKNIDNVKPIEELMYIKSRVVKESEGNDFRYMDMHSKEFSDKKVLPEILEQDNKELRSKIVTKKKAREDESRKNRNKKQNKQNRKRNNRIKGNRKESLKHNPFEDALKNWGKDN